MIALIFALVIQLGANPQSDYGFPFGSAANSVVDMHFADAAHGWILHRSGDKAQIGSTTDGGDHWNFVAAPDDAARLWFVSEERGWVLSVLRNRGKLLNRLYMTRDGGRTWNAGPILADLPYRDQVFAKDMAFFDANRGWIIMTYPDRDVMLETVDGGTSFTQIQLPIADQVQDIAIGQSDAVLVTAHGIIIPNLPPNKQLVLPKGPIDQRFRTGLLDSMFYLGGSAQSKAVIFRSKDRGLTWEQSFSSDDGISFDSLSSLGSNRVCAVGQTRFIWCSLDSGATWKKFAAVPVSRRNLSPRFSRLHLISNTEALLLRDGGFLYRTNDAGKTWNMVNSSGKGVLPQASANDHLQ